MWLFRPRQVSPVLREFNAASIVAAKTQLDGASVSRENRYGLAAWRSVPRPRRFVQEKNLMLRGHRLGILLAIVCAAIFFAIATPSLRSRPTRAPHKPQP